jgi:hypothetical protein
MRKQELVHLHALGVACRRQVDADAAPAAFEAYEDLGVSPTSIHRRKDAHREAILRLFAGVAVACADDPAAAAPDPDQPSPGDWDRT